MIVDKVQDGIAFVRMTKEEAHVLHDGLTIAKLQVGEALLLGGRPIVSIEHMRGILMGIAES